MKPTTQMKVINNKQVSLSARWTHAESETLHRQADRMNFGDVSSWSRSSVWFKRPDDVKQERVSRPVHSLAPLLNPSRGAIAPSERIVMSGKYSGVTKATVPRATGDSPNDIASLVDKKLRAGIKRAKPSADELAAIKEAKAIKRNNERERARIIREVNARIKHAKAVKVDREAEEAKNQTLSAFERMMLDRKVCNAEEAALDPAMWAEVQREIDAEMA